MNKTCTKKSKTLSILTAAAIALPGLQTNKAAAQSAVEKPELSYRYSEYQEEEVEVELGAGDPERYAISVHQLRFKSRIASSADIIVDLQYEEMSGASPWYVLRSEEESPILVMSSATINEARTDLQTRFSSYYDTIVTTTSIGYSTENDYDSFSMGYAVSKSMRDKNVTLDIGISGSQDFVEPTPINEYWEAFDRERKNSFGTSIGLSGLINKTSMIGAGLGLVRYEGYLSDPYKRVQVLGLPFLATVSTGPCPANLCADSRPAQKHQMSFDLKYRKRFVGPNAALHWDYRYYQNDWELNSHTVEFSWYQNFLETWQIVPRLRWYAQTEAAFYQPWFEAPRTDGYYSSDYRLSPFDALGLSLKVTKASRFGTFHLAWERYQSTPGESDNMPGVEVEWLVNYDFISLGMDYKF